MDLNDFALANEFLKKIMLFTLKIVDLFILSFDELIHLDYLGFIRGLS